MNHAVNSFQGFDCARPSTTNNTPIANIAVPETTNVAEATLLRIPDI